MIKFDSTSELYIREERLISYTFNIRTFQSNNDILILMFNSILAGERDDYVLDILNGVVGQPDVTTVDKGLHFRRSWFGRWLDYFDNPANTIVLPEASWISAEVASDILLSEPAKLIGLRGLISDLCVKYKDKGYGQEVRRVDYSRSITTGELQVVVEPMSQLGRDIKEKVEGIGKAIFLQEDLDLTFSLFEPDDFRVENNVPYYMGAYLGGGPLTLQQIYENYNDDSIGEMGNLMRITTTLSTLSAIINEKFIIDKKKL